jgi:tetrapyrrole methylase family protein / MazG family protein
MAEFTKLIEITERLLGPGGCPWDQEQTMMTIRTTILEEVCEVIEAIDVGDNPHIRDELGDLFFNVIFLCKLAEKENRFTLQDVIQTLIDKLIRRHPHVFADVQGIDTVDALIKQWDKIKKSESAHTHRTSDLDGIPRDLPSLARAQKMLKKISKTAYSAIPEEDTKVDVTSEESLGQALLTIVAQAQAVGLDAEQALRKTLATLDKDFRHWEVSK